MRKRLLGLCVLALCGAIAMTFLFPQAASAQPLPLKPNLQPFPPFNLMLTPDSTGGREIRFSTRSWNKGLGPLELVAEQGDSSGQKVYQRVYYDDGTSQDSFVGTFVWHPAHNHFHFGGYALYYLEPISAPGGSPKSGNKTTFCVMDTNSVDTSLEGAPSIAVYDTCGSAVQGMSVGWADTYGYTLAGQSVNFTGNPSGDYCLTIRIDPNERLLETDDSDNVASSLLRVDVERSTITVLSASGCTPIGGDVVVAGITPNSGKVGTTVPVVITGSGFTPGMGVSFDGGSGPSPSVSSVVVAPHGTIHANVTVKKGKPGRDPVWDLRVGSGLLFGGFTVKP